MYYKIVTGCETVLSTRFTLTTHAIYDPVIFFAHRSHVYHGNKRSTASHRLLNLIDLLHQTLRLFCLYHLFVSGGSNSPLRQPPRMTMLKCGTFHVWFSAFYPLPIFSFRLMPLPTDRGIAKSKRKKNYNCRKLQLPLFRDIIQTVESKLNSCNNMHIILFYFLEFRTAVSRG